MDNGDFALGYAMADNNSCCNGNNNGWGNGGWGDWIVIILFAMIFGWGNGGFGGGFGNGAGLNGALTRADLCQDMNFSQLENAVRGVQQGICDSTFSLNNTIVNGFNGVQRDMCTGFSNVAAGISENRFATQQGFNATQVAMMQGQNALQAQISDCCCRTNNNIERGFADVGYRMATDTCAIQTAMANNTRDIIDSQAAGTRAILDYLCQEKISDLQTENQSLRLAASQSAQNNYLISQLRPCPVPSYITCNPWAAQAPYGSCTNYGNQGCGCGCC